MSSWKAAVGAWVREAVAPTVRELTKEALVRIAVVVEQSAQAVKAADAAVAEVRTLKAQMSALMALDVGFKEMGKVILLTRIGDQDRVKIIDVKPTMTVADYQILVERLKHDFGVGDPVYLDEPRGHHLRDILVDAGTIAPVRRGVRSR